MRRKCAECPTWTQTVCRHVFGANWGDKSRNGEGCDFHLDDVAEAWRKAGWTPEKGTTKEITLPLPGAPTMPRRPVRGARIVDASSKFLDVNITAEMRAYVRALAIERKENRTR